MMKIKAKLLKAREEREVLLRSLGVQLEGAARAASHEIRWWEFRRWLW